MKSLEQLQELVLEWAWEKNLLFPENAPKQKLKLIEECGELARAILKNDVKEQKDAIGDIFVVLIILSEQLELELDFDLTTGYMEKLDFNITRLIDSAYFECTKLSFGYLVELSLRLNISLVECANIAYNEIKDRTGKTVNGTFIKD